MITKKDISCDEVNTIYNYMDQIKMDQIKNNLGDKNLKYCILTYGCQMNVHDSEKLSGMLEYIGYSKTDVEDNADIIIFNTCCVREHAEQKVYGNVGALREYKKQNPNVIICVCGCMMQQKDIAYNLAKKFPFIDIIFGTHNMHHFPQLLYEALYSSTTVVEIVDEQKRPIEHLPIIRNKKVSAWVTVMYGCNNFCSYCIVPYVRGREKSRQPSDILKEIEKIADDGFKEITLLGQNVNSYGKDLNKNYLFHDLLRDIEKIDGIERVRFMTSHPKDLSIDLINAMAECEKVCEHLHLPIQSGSNRILKAMNRHYTNEDYLELVGKIRQSIPEIALTTDIIVGFPGETEQDFDQTLNIVRKIKFDSAFTFMYSPRTGTPAAIMEQQISDGVKKERLAKLMETQNEITRDINKIYQDKIVEVLVEGPGKNDPDLLSGRTRTNKLVNFKGDINTIGCLVDVNITQAKNWTLKGIMI